MHAGVPQRRCCEAAEGYSADQWEEDVSGRTYFPAMPPIHSACMHACAIIINERPRHSTHLSLT